MENFCKSACSALLQCTQIGRGWNQHDLLVRLYSRTSKTRISMIANGVGFAPGFLHCASRHVRSEANVKKRRRLAPVGMTTNFTLQSGESCRGIFSVAQL